jgi:hypothetical protein
MNAIVEQTKSNPPGKVARDRQPSDSRRAVEKDELQLNHVNFPTKVR